MWGCREGSLSRSSGTRKMKTANRCLRSLDAELLYASLGYRCVSHANHAAAAAAAADDAAGIGVADKTAVFRPSSISMTESEGSLPPRPKLRIFAVISESVELLLLVEARLDVNSSCSSWAATLADGGNRS